MFKWNYCFQRPIPRSKDKMTTSNTMRREVDKEQLYVIVNLVEKQYNDHPMVKEAKASLFDWSTNQDNAMIVSKLNSEIQSFKSRS